ncbi:hypothetical protein C8J56DRAFT_4766 [Mycena floridula]|nr:hypothetical protein C8J56DRAFT_4766 [Mycena floridula]
MPTFERFPDIYARNLLSLGHGYPLPYPQPSDDLPRTLPIRWQTGVCIGDVGVLTKEGCFDYLFNIHASADDPVNGYGVPENFVPLPESRRGLCELKRYHTKGILLSSAGTVGRKIRLDVGTAMPFAEGSLGWEISSSRSEGAVLALRDGADRYDHRNLDQLREYAEKNAVAWYKHAQQEFGSSILNGSLYLVSGCDKSRSCQLAAFEQPHRQKAEISFRFAVAGAASGGLSLAHATARHRSLDTRHFMSSNKKLTPFIRGFKIALRTITARVRGAVKLSSIVDSPISLIMAKGGRLPGSSESLQSHCSSSSSGSGSNSQGLTRVYRPFVDSDESSDEGDWSADESSDDEADHPFNTEPFHPSNIINNYLLDSIDSCNVAITHDDEWRALLTDQDLSFPDDAELERRVQEKYEVVVHGGAIQLRPRVVRPTRTQRHQSPTDVTWTTGKKAALPVPDSSVTALDDSILERDLLHGNQSTILAKPNCFKAPFNDSEQPSCPSQPEIAALSTR